MRYGSGEPGVEVGILFNNTLDYIEWPLYLFMFGPQTFHFSKHSLVLRVYMTRHRFAFNEK